MPWPSSLDRPGLPLAAFVLDVALPTGLVLFPQQRAASIAPCVAFGAWTKPKVKLRLVIVWHGISALIHVSHAIWGRRGRWAPRLVWYCYRLSEGWLLWNS